MKAFSLLVTGLIFALATTAGVAANSGLIVSHHEELREFSLQSSAAGTLDATSVPAATSTVMSFNALGRSYDLLLTDNSRILSGDARKFLREDMQLLRGTVSGAAGSWARITIADGVPQGFVWDGEQMIVIEAPGNNAAGTDTSVVYRLADTYVVPGTMSCGDGATMTSGAQAYRSLVSEISAAQAQAPGATQEIEISFIGDFELSGVHANPGDAILNRVSIVDGIFSEDVGVQITVPVLETYSDAADPFTDETDANNLLVELGAYRAGDSNHNSRGLTHLYTGKNLDDTTVGIAYTGALCLAQFGAGLSQGNFDLTTDALIAAHELGHNFGAPHDGVSGSACESEPETFLMASSINGSDEFSACSVTEMQDDIAAAVVDGCITALPSTDMSISLSGTAPTVLLGNSASLTFDVTNVGNADATNVSADITLPGTVTFVSIGSTVGSCTNGAGTANCQLGTMAGGAAETVTITSITDAVGSATFDASISADVDENAANDSTSASVTVDPAIDLVVTAPAAQQVDIGQSRNLSVTIQNLSSLVATDLVISITADSGVQPDTATWTVGDCTISVQQVDCTAANLGAQAASTLTIGVSGQIAGTQNVTLTATANETDRDTANNNATGTFTVNDPNTGNNGNNGNSDSGGGAFGTAFLTLLGMLLIGRRRRPVR